MSGLRLSNTMTGIVEEFSPAGSPVSMYVCGPTVYGEAHVGNARPVVVFDVLFRLLRHLYGEVHYARNITDIDDKIIAAAREAGLDFTEVARRYEGKFHQAMAELGNLPPTFEPRATEHMGEMVAIIATLLDKEHAYVAEGHVLFAVDSFADYGKLANRNRDEMIAGTRVEVVAYKRAPEDFVLWKPSGSEQPGWDSPWGRGRPGWHLECSAMIHACLGETIDIHGGGNDLTFPHHENEIAQSRCSLATPALARFWVHNGHVTMEGRKMAKSAGNFAVLSEVLAQHSGEVVRYALLAAHYRGPLDWGPAALTAAKTALTRLYRTLAAGPVRMPKRDVLPEGFLKALLSDLNTPLALASLHDLASRANREEGPAASATRGMLLAAGNFIGLLNTDAGDWLHNSAAAAGDTDTVIAGLLREREQARARGDYVMADQLRAELAADGIHVEDSAQGTAWHRR